MIHNLNKKWLAVFLLAISFTTAGASVRSRSDSLHNSLHLAATDTAHVRILLSLSKLWRDSSAFQSLTYALEAERLSEKTSWTKGRILSGMAAGACYDVVKQWDNALQSYTMSKDLALQACMYAYVLQACERISETYNSAGRADSSLFYKLQTLHMARELKDTFAQAQMLTFLGGYYINIKNYPLSLYYWDAAKQLLEACCDKRAYPMALNNMGVIYMAMGNHDSAISVMRRALEAVQLFPEPDSKLCINATLSDYYKGRGQTDSAIFYARQAIKVTAAADVDKGNEEAIYLQLFSLYEASGQADKALSMYKLYIALHVANDRKLQNSEDAKSVMKYEYALQTNIRRSEHNALLNKSDLQQKQLLAVGLGLLFMSLLAAVYYYSLLQNRRKASTITLQAEELFTQKQIIQHSLQEKEVLIKEIHHRVKNNLQVISALLQLQGKRTDDIAVKEALGESQNRVLSIAFIHQNLYQHDEINRVDMKEFVCELVKHIDNIYAAPNRSITIQQEVNAGILDLQFAIPLALIINELLTNSYKYAFTGRMEGAVSISIKRDAETDKCYFEYSDDGPGIAAHIDPGAGKTLGLTLVHDLCRQLGAIANYDSVHGFQLTFCFDLAGE